MNTCEGFGSNGLRIMKALEAKDPKVKTSAPRRDTDEGSYNRALETHLRTKKTSEAKASRIQTYAS